jgi:DNA polymerase V
MGATAIETAYSALPPNALTPHRVGRTAYCPFVGSRVSAGFPSPAEDSLERGLDLNEYLIDHQAATFFVRVKGPSMIGAGIHDGDTLIVDRAVEPRDGSVVVALVDGEFTVKRLRRNRGCIALVAENPAYEPITITPGCDFEVWGVVTYAIHQL